MRHGLSETQHWILIWVLCMAAKVCGTARARVEFERTGAPEELLYTLVAADII